MLYTYSASNLLNSSNIPPKNYKHMKGYSSSNSILEPNCVLHKIYCWTGVKIKPALRNLTNKPCLPGKCAAPTATNTAC
jgi:hypothetical protein